MKLGWKGTVGIALSAVLIWYTLRGVDPAAVWDQIRIADFRLLAASIAVAVLGYFLRAFRWRVLLHPVDPHTRLGSRFRALIIGFMANNLLPARVGEFARAYAMGRLEPRVTVSAAFGSLVVERVMDGLVLGAFLVGATLTPGFPADALGAGFGSILTAAMTLLGFMLASLAFLLLFPRPVVGVVETLAALLPAGAARTVVDAMEAFLESLAVVRSPLLLAQALAWSVAFWFWHGLSFYLGMLAFGIDLGLVAAIFTEAVVGFAVALPAAPGFFGTFHVGAQFALENVYGAGPAETLAFAYAYHLGGFIPVTLLGLWYVRSVGLSLSEVGSSEEAVEEAVERELEL
ncbi:MAG TPA: lysylphosphatidylglycerol synthase transmembrane domain-containing protein [Longimicrobiales bacterium]|nr:lysylphosphatidylglycerol synthase transmembrane domain-containing protein [Longimicrobiales bacterium]